MAKAIAELACWLAYNEVARRETESCVAESAVEDCVRRFVATLKIDAPQFVAALRAYATQPGLVDVGARGNLANDAAAATRTPKRPGARHPS